MANRLARLLSRGSSRPEPAPSVVPTGDRGALALDTAAVGPPMLLPAVIFRQVLFDPTEFTPAWLKPRPAPAPEPLAASATTDHEAAPASTAPPAAAPPAAATAAEAKPVKRTRRATPAGSPSRAKSSSSADGTTTKRARRTKKAATDD